MFHIKSKPKKRALDYYYANKETISQKRKEIQTAITRRQEKVARV